MNSKKKPIFTGAQMPSTMLDTDWPYSEIDHDNKKRALEGESPVRTCNIWGKMPDVAAFMEGIEKLGGRLVSASESLTSDGTHRTYLWARGVARLQYQGDEYGGFKISVTEEKLYNKLMELVQENVVDKLDDEEGHIYLLAQTQRGIQPYSLGNAAVPVARGNYSEAVLKAFDAIVEQMRSEDPFGRLVLLEGKPGSGKTYLVRHLAHALPDALFVYAPPSIAGNMDSPQLVPALLDLRQTASRNNRVKRIVLVVEDADALVEKRTENSTSVLSTLLNLTSGMLGDLTNIFILATYNNVDATKLDPAIVRDGRMLAHVQVNELDKGQGQHVLERLLEKADAVYDGPPLLSAVYKAARALGWKDKREPVETGRKRRRYRVG